MWGSRQATGTTDGAVGPAEAGPAATGVRGDGAPAGGSAVGEPAMTNGRDAGERAPPGGSAEAGATVANGRDDSERAPFVSDPAIAPDHHYRDAAAERVDSSSVLL